MVDFPVGMSQKIRAIWGKEDEHGYGAEVSTLKGNLGVYYNTCPKCMRPYNGTHLVKTDARDGDIMGWHFRHVCGAKLLVIND